MADAVGRYVGEARGAQLIVKAAVQHGGKEWLLAIVGVPVEDDGVEEGHCSERRRVGNHDIRPRFHDAEHFSKQLRVHLGRKLVVQRVGDHRVETLVGLSGVDRVALLQVDLDALTFGELMPVLEEKRR